MLIRLLSVVYSSLICALFLIGVLLFDSFPSLLGMHTIGDSNRSWDLLMYTIGSLIVTIILLFFYLVLGPVISFIIDLLVDNTNTNKLIYRYVLKLSCFIVAPLLLFFKQEDALQIIIVFLSLLYFHVLFIVRREYRVPKKNT